MSLRNRKVGASKMKDRRDDERRRSKGARKPPAMPTIKFVRRCTKALELMDEIGDDGAHYADSCREKIESMREWADENDYVTEAMTLALRNMVAGARRWLDDGGRE